MSQSNNKELEMAVGTSNMLESNMMETDNFYTPMETATEPESATQSQWTGVKNDTGQLCRVCANSSDYAVPIYEGEGLEHQLEFKIQKHLPIHVSITDMLPLQLCYQCASTLIAYDSMLSNCLDAEKKLKAMQEAAEEAAEEASKTNEEYDDSQLDTAPAADSDDEPLIQSKTKLLSEKTKATPIKKKILSKAKTRSVTVKTDKTATNSKEGEDKERRLSESDDSPLRTEVKVEREELESPLNSIDVNMIKQEESSSSFECTICKNSYSTKLNLNRHIKNVHTYDKIKCTVCDVEMTKKSYQRHLKKIHGFNQPKTENNDENKCKDEEEEEDVPGEGPNEEKSAESNQESINPCEVLCKVEMNEDKDGEKNVDLCFQGVECKICNQTYSNELNLKKHVYNVHRMVRVKCHICDKEVNKKSLDRHMKSVHSAKVSVKKERKPVPDEEKIPCNMCGKKCLNLASLQNHIKNIHQAEQFKCTQCEFRGIKRHLDKHIKKQHSEEVFQCNRCQKILKSKSTLKEHMWIHTDHRRFICDICGMRFKRTSNYHGHMKSHQDKKFQCQLCGNFFLRKRYLAVHEQTIHNYYGEGVPPQEKGYQCEVCGVKLKWKNNLLAHMRIHTGEKPYKCKICGDDFTCHGSLRTHMAKHAICQTPHDVSSVFIQHAFLENRTAPAAPPVATVFSPSTDSVI